VKVLLDTCTFLWIIEDAPDLSARARELFLDEEVAVFLSAVSAWEIAVKHASGRLTLALPPDRLVPEQRRLRGIEALPLEEEATFQLARLPGLHRDPFDRMLIAQAIHHGLALLTPDEAIRRYPVRTIW
jgi:PIN domain nuclease of toxin-antitoxin system